MQRKVHSKVVIRTLSSSAANAIEFFKTERLEEFKDSSATIQEK